MSMSAGAIPPTLTGLGDTAEVLVRCAVANRTPGCGFAIETAPGVAAECGAPAAGEADAGDCLEEALEADLRPRGAAAAAERNEAYYRKMVDALIARIEEGTAPWTQAWKAGEKAMSCNVVTGKAYRGGNSVWPASVADRRGYSDERWGTYKQVQSLDGQERRGEKGSAILFWQFEMRKLARDRAGRPVLDEEGKPVYDTVPLDRPRSYPYTVSNAEQCDGLPRREPRAGAHSWDAIEEAERVLKESGAMVENSGKNRAYYDLRRDRIILPYRQQFPSGPAYHQTALHELGHWTGHPSRLNRLTLMKGIEEGFASPHYAREELQAEISSIMTGDRLQLGHDPSRHAAYVGSWLQALRDDPREIYRAAQNAQVMSDYVLGRARERVPKRDSEPAAGRERPPGEPLPRRRTGPSPGGCSAERSPRRAGRETRNGIACLG